MANKYLNTALISTVIDRTFDAMTQQALLQLNQTKRAYMHRRTN